MVINDGHLGIASGPCLVDPLYVHFPMVYSIQLHMKHAMCSFCMDFHGSAICSDRDDETCSPWIMPHVFGPDARVLKVALYTS